MEDFGGRGPNIEVLVWAELATAPEIAKALGAQTTWHSSHIPRNSTQLISMSSLSPSADNGRSSSRLRRTYGPVSSEVRGLVLELETSSGSLSSMF